jgi:hypothetical protein
MIYLSITQSNNVIVTLYDSCNNKYNPYFAWKVINQDTLVETIFTADDNSYTPWNYNSFTISPAGLTAGILDLKQGQYKYEVYEMSNPYILDLNLAVKQVETGILNIIGTSSTTSTYVGNQNLIPTYNNL